MSTIRQLRRLSELHGSCESGMNYQGARVATVMAFNLEETGKSLSRDTRVWPRFSILDSASQNSETYTDSSPQAPLNQLR